MTARRLHAPNLPEEGGTVELDEAASHHVRVLRLGAGDAVELFDGRGLTAAARIHSFADRVVCMAEAPIASNSNTARVVLMLAVPKGSTLDNCVRMGTELGVDEIALMHAERSVPHWNASRARSRTDRLIRVAAMAAAQSERAGIPIIRGPQPCKAWIDVVPPGASRVVFGARAKGSFVLGERPEQVWCAVGPEGGFSDEELAAFEAAGFFGASLGPSILRVDTAVAAALTVVQDRLLASQAR